MARNRLGAGIGVNVMNSNRVVRLSIVGALALLLSDCCHPATIAVNPITGVVRTTRGNAIRRCDQAVANCQSGVLGFEPVDAAATDSGIVFVTRVAVYRCDVDGNSCSAGTRLTFSDATSVAAGPGARVVVASESGAIDTCDQTTCTLVP